MPEGSVAAFQDRLTWILFSVFAVRPVGAAGGVVSTEAGVVTDTAPEADDALPAASKATRLC
jgi:hypothetical protein